jgi:hypothetical protein
MADPDDIRHGLCHSEYIAQEAGKICRHEDVNGTVSTRFLVNLYCLDTCCDLFHRSRLILLSYKVKRKLLDDRCSFIHLVRYYSLRLVEVLCKFPASSDSSSAEILCATTPSREIEPALAMEQNIFVHGPTTVRPCGVTSAQHVPSESALLSGHKGEN